jgi:hypothetical protein
MGRGPASRKVKGALGDFPFTTLQPAAVLDESARWEKLWNELFLQK